MENSQSGVSPKLVNAGAQAPTGCTHLPVLPIGPLACRTAWGPLRPGTGPRNDTKSQGYPASIQQGSVHPFPDHFFMPSVREALC